MPTATFEGQLLRAGSRDPVAGAWVSIEGREGRSLTDDSGVFTLPEAPVGVVALQVVSPGERPALVPARVEADGGEPAVLYVRLVPVGDTVVVMGKRDAPPVTERTLDIEELRAVPGALGDAVRAVQNLPGVAWSPLSLGLLIVRGNYPEDSGFFIDGVPVPLIYHFLGVRTVINTDMLERLVFMPGGFGVRYGRVMGGVIDLGTKMSHAPRHHGYAEIDTFMSTLYATGPIGEKTGFTLSLRRSYIDRLMAPVLSRLDLDYYIQAPQFWDYQVAVDRWVGERHHLRVMALGSNDTVAVFGEPPADVDEGDVQSALFDYEVGVTQLQLRWDALLSDRLFSEATLALGPQPNRLQVGSASLNDNPFFIAFREELRFSASDWMSIRGGLDAQFIHQDIRVESSSGDDVFEPTLAWTASPSPYAEATLNLGEDLTLTPGVRVDPLFIQGQANRISADPRIAGRLRLGEKTWLKGAMGRYSAFPNAYEILEGLGSPDLGAEHATQTSLGVERGLGPRLSLDVVGYFNAYRDLVLSNELEVSSVDLFLGTVETSAGDYSLYSNRGEGRAYGVEFLLRRRVGDRYWGWVAYALQRSERRDGADNPWLTFIYDQTHLLTLVGVAELPRQWQLGLRLRYGTGRPFTPVDARVYNVDNATYSPIPGALNSDRYPALGTLDLRAERVWTFDRWSLVGYVSVENATNHKNVESHYFSWDYAQLYFITGLPIVPIFGVRGAW